MLAHHTGFLDSCLKDCMLTNPELLRAFSKLMSVCVMFTNCMQVCSARPAAKGPCLLVLTWGSVVRAWVSVRACCLQCSNTRTQNKHGGRGGDTGLLGLEGTGEGLRATGEPVLWLVTEAMGAGVPAPWMSSPLGGRHTQTISGAVSPALDQVWECSDTVGRLRRPP